MVLSSIERVSTEPPLFTGEKKICLKSCRHLRFKAGLFQPILVKAWGKRGHLQLCEVMCAVCLGQLSISRVISGVPCLQELSRLLDG